jgi:hypothetical protein
MRVRPSAQQPHVTRTPPFLTCKNRLNPDSESHSVEQADGNTMIGQAHHWNEVCIQVRKQEFLRPTETGPMESAPCGMVPVVPIVRGRFEACMREHRGIEKMCMARTVCRTMALECVIALWTNRIKRIKIQTVTKKSTAGSTPARSNRQNRWCVACCVCLDLPGCIPSHRECK